jgi:hypothetical protein
MEADVVATTTATLGSLSEKAETVTRYVSKNNSGTITFTPTAMNSSNLSYDIETMLKVYFYVNGSLEDSVDMPFDFHVPPTTSTSNYKMVTNDSLYFSSGSMFRDGSPTQQTEASGARIKRDGDKMQLIIKTNKSTTENDQGMIVTNASRGVGIITLQKQ